MLLIATVDPVLQRHLQQALIKKSEPFLLIQEGEDIVDATFHHQPSLIILDLYWSKPSGLHIFQQLRSSGYSGKVLVLGGPSAQPLASEALRLGALQIVGGPFTASQVLEAAHVNRYSHARPSRQLHIRR